MSDDLSERVADIFRLMRDKPGDRASLEAAINSILDLPEIASALKLEAMMRGISETGGDVSVEFRDGATLQ